MAQTRYECSQCDKVSCNKAAADQHNRDMHGSCAGVFSLRSRREMLAEIARLKRDKEALHSTIENCVSAGASLQAEIARLTAELREARMQSVSDASQAQMAYEAQLKAETERDAALAQHPQLLATIRAQEIQIDAIAAAAFEAAAQHIEHRNGPIPFRQEIAKEIRNLARAAETENPQ